MTDIKRVIIRATGEGIAFCATVERIVAVTATEQVAAATGGDAVIAVTAIKRVVRVTVMRIGGSNGIVTGTAIQQNLQAAAGDRVISRSPGNADIAAAAGEGVCPGRAQSRITPHTEIDASTDGFAVAVCCDHGEGIASRSRGRAAEHAGGGVDREPCGECSAAGEFGGVAEGIAGVGVGEEAVGVVAVGDAGAGDLVGDGAGEDRREVVGLCRYIHHCACCEASAVAVGERNLQRACGGGGVGAVGVGEVFQQCFDAGLGGVGVESDGEVCACRSAAGERADDGATDRHITPGEADGAGSIKT